MPTEYIIDLGEDGQIIVVSTTPSEGEEKTTGLVDAARGDVGKAVKRIVNNPKAVLTAPLKAMGKLFTNAIPALDSENYQLDEFTIEFGVDIGTEAGVDNPLVTAKIMPAGNFKCTYKWGRKEKSQT